MVSGRSSPFKTICVTGAQAIQTEQHAKHYGRDSTKGAPNEPFIKNFDRYSRNAGAETQIVHMFGMSRTEQHLHPYFESRSDLIIPKENLARLEMQTEREKAKWESIEIRAENAGVSPLKFMKTHGLTIDFDYLNRDSDYFSDTLTDRGTHYNQKVALANVNCPPQNKNPDSPGKEFAQESLEKTIIHAHPRQKFVPVPKSLSDKLPRLQLTTGACTQPNYNELDSRGKTAKRAHQYGFVRVDIFGDKTYLPRLIPANADGTLFDRGKIYRPGERPRNAKTLALCLGDLHHRHMDPLAWEATIEMIAKLKPEKVFIHDGIDGDSCTHWDLKDRIRRVRKFREGRTEVRDEVAQYAKFITALAKDFKKTDFLHVPDNHGHFLYRWANLPSGNITEENTEFWHELNLSLIKNPEETTTAVETAIGLIGPMPSNVGFLRWGQDFKIYGYQFGAHGHKGVNGARGSFKSMKQSYGKAIFGHGHAMTVDGRTFSVGTMSKIPQFYQLGQPGNTMHGNVALYEGGIPQGLPIINGIW